MPVQDVADGQDACRSRLEVVVDLDAVLGAGVDADGLEVQPLDIREPAGGDQQVRARGLAGRPRRRVPVRADLQAVADLDAGDLDSRPERDPLGGQQRLDTIGDLGILAGQDVGGVGQDGDHGPEPREHLRELQAGRPGPQDDQARGQRVKDPERHIVERAGLGQAGDPGQGRARSGRDHEPLRLDPRLAIEDDRVVRLERGRATVDVDPAGAERVARIAAGESVDDGSDPRHHGGEIDLGRGDPNPEVARRADLVDQSGRLDEPLARHACRVGAFPPQRVLLDQRDPRPDSGRLQGHAQSPRASPQHHKVVHRPFSPRTLQEVFGHQSSVDSSREKGPGQRAAPLNCGPARSL